MCSFSSRFLFSLFLKILISHELDTSTYDTSLNECQPELSLAYKIHLTLPCILVSSSDGQTFETQFDTINIRSIQPGQPRYPVKKHLHS